MLFLALLYALSDGINMYSLVNGRVESCAFRILAAASILDCLLTAQATQPTVPSYQVC